MRHGRNRNVFAGVISGSMLALAVSASVTAQYTPPSTKPPPSPVTNDPPKAPDQPKAPTIAPPAAPEKPAPPPMAKPTANDPAKALTSDMPMALEPVDPKWLERIDKDDRAALDELLGYAPPPLTSELEWIVPTALPEGGWDSYRGKVLLIQSWSAKTDSGRKLPLRAAKAIEGHEAQAQVLALHTPDGVDACKEYLAKRPVETGHVVIDPTGAFCDALGVYKKPVNILIDKNGVVRYAGLNAAGLEKALEKLAAEPADPKLKPPARAAAAAPSADVNWPEISGPVGSAYDMRGRTAPEFVVDEWMTSQPRVGSGVVVIDYWATWCGPCRASIPHMNELTREFGNQAAFLAVSDETESKFRDGLRKYDLDMDDDFAYALALDPKARMKGALGINGIPHCTVISSDWIIRWQGHPANLSAKIVKQIIDADKAMNTAKLGSSSSRKRWTK